MRTVIRLQVLAMLTLVLSCGNNSPTERPFLMGFSAAPHERTSSGKIQAKQFLAQNAEIAVEDFSEGVPWEESLHNQPLPSEVLTSLRIRKRMLEGKSLILLISPLNLKQTDIGIYWPITTAASIQNVWSKKKIGDSDVTAAYLRFCQQMIRHFHPKYVGYGVDVNRFAEARPDQWNDFVNLSKEIYHGLKKAFPNIPIFVSFDVSTFWKNPELQRQRIQEIMPYSDLIAVSAYPHLAGYTDVGKLPHDFFSKLAGIAPSKPFVIVDTGYPQSGTSKDKDSQKKYLEFVLGESSKLKAKFVIWFHYRDFKKVVEEAQSKHKSAEVVEMFHSRSECGLIGDAGKPKNSFSVWKQWFQLPIVNTR